MLRAVVIGLPILNVVLGVPLVLRMVPPNRLYGFRTPTTLSAPAAWYPINVATCLALIVAGLLGGIAVLLLSVGMIALEPELRYVAGVLTTAVVTLASLIPVVIYASRFGLDPPNPAKSGLLLTS
jgi:hypothetical protein